MNFYNSFLREWSDRFPNQTEPNGVNCLKADNYFSVNDQKLEIEKLLKSVSNDFQDLKEKYQKLEYFSNYLKSSVNKLDAVAQLFDDNLPKPVCQFEENMDHQSSNIFFSPLENLPIESNWLPLINETNGFVSGFVDNKFGEVKSEYHNTQTKAQHPQHVSVPVIDHNSTVSESSGGCGGHPSSSQHSMDATSSTSLIKCTECPRVFVHQTALELHQKLHSGERPYECPVCGRAFKLKAQLEIHSRVHSGERPFGCRVCGKLFRQQCHVVQHLRSHTDERPYQCSVCGKRFRQKHSLVSHEERQCQTRRQRRPGDRVWIGLPGGCVGRAGL